MLGLLGPVLAGPRGRQSLAETHLGGERNRWNQGTAPGPGAPSKGSGTWPGQGPLNAALSPRPCLPPGIRPNGVKFTDSLGAITPLNLQESLVRR